MTKDYPSLSKHLATPPGCPLARKRGREVQRYSTANSPFLRVIRWFLSRHETCHSAVVPTPPCWFWGLRSQDSYLHHPSEGVGAGVSETAGDCVQPQSTSNTTTRLSAEPAAIDTKSNVLECVMPTIAPVPTTVSSFSPVVVADDSIPSDVSLSYITICRRSRRMARMCR